MRTEKKFQLVHNWIFIPVWNECRNGYFKKPVEINRGNGTYHAFNLLRVLIANLHWQMFWSSNMGLNQACKVNLVLTETEFTMCIMHCGSNRQRPKCLYIQVTNYEIVVNFFHISHKLTWYLAMVHKFTRIYLVCPTY